MTEFVLVEDVNQLRTYPLFSRLSEEQVRRFMSICREETFLPGAVMHRQGDPAREVYLILSGEVAEELQIQDKVLSPIKPLSAGDVTGCSALFPPNVHTCTARTITEVNTLVIDAERMRQLFDEDCDIARSIYRYLIGSLHHRMRTLELNNASQK